MSKLESTTCTPNDLYAQEPEQIVKVFDGTVYYGNPHSLWGCYYNHVPEVAEEYHHGKWAESDKIEMQVYKYFDFDGRRWWRLASVWYSDGGDFVPVMIIRNAGREGDDFRDRFITNPEAYSKMVNHIFSLRVVEEEKINPKDVVDPDAEIKGLLDFYGNSLYGWFERYTF